jgi:hypothetical protein
MSEKEKTLNEAKKNYDAFMRSVREAQALASREGIKANSIIINENFVKIVNKGKLRLGLGEIRPMICGLNVFLDYDGFLPEDYSFAVVDIEELRDSVEEKDKAAWKDSIYKKQREELKEKFLEEETNGK